MTDSNRRQKRDSKELFTEILQQEVDNISGTWDIFDKQAFDAAIRTIGKARHIVIVALRESQILGEYLRRNLNLLFSDVILVSTSCSGEIPEQLLHVTDKDCVIGISFPNYSKLTLKAMEFANRRNAQIITLTDHEHCPITIYSSCNLIARSQMSSVSFSLTAAMSYIDALIAALYIRHSGKAKENIEILNAFHEEFSEDDADEMNPPADRIEYEQLELKL